MSRAFPRYAPGFALLLVLAACFQGLLSAPGALIVDADRPMVDHAYRGRPRDVGNDLTSVFLPRFAYIASILRSDGRIPFWDAAGFGGRPLLGNPQAGLFYPPVWAAYLSGRPSSLGWLTLAHLFVGGLGAYALARSYGLSRGASVVTGGCFEASPYLLAHAFEGHYPHVWAACWYPWAFRALGVAANRGAAGLLALPAVLALAFLTGHPQEWYYLVLALSGWAAADAFRRWRGGSTRDGLFVLAAWGGVLALSLGLCASALLPELATRPWLLKSSVIPIRLQNRYQLQFVNLFQLVHPFALGGPDRYFGHDNYWETLLSIGLTPMVLALVGLGRHPDRSLATRWGVLTGVSVVFAAGRRLGLYPLAYAVLPGMDRFRVPSRTLFLASLGAAVLAGAGVDVLRSEGGGARSLRRWLAGGLVGLVVVVVVLAGVERSEPGRPGPSDARLVPTIELAVKAAGSVASEPTFWANGFALLVVAAAASARRGSGPTLAWGLGAVALLELGLYGRALLVVSPVEALVAKAPAVEAARALLASSSGPLRVASVGGALGDLDAALGGLEKTNVNDGFQIQHAADVYQQLYPFLEAAPVPGKVEGPMDAAVEARRAAVARAAMDVLGVGVLVSERPTHLPGLEPVDAGPGRLAWRNPSAVPRAYVVPRARVVDDRDVPAAVRLLGLEPRREVLLRADPLGGRARQAFTPAEWLSDDPAHVRLRVETSAAGYLVVGNAWMPGWSATVDGRPAPVFPGNGWQQVLAIPGAGRHEVALRYRPPGLAPGLGLTAASLLVWGGAAAVVALRAKRPVRVRPADERSRFVPAAA